ncbi:hypothetical protein CYMTET_31223 [Cymbomonas tetramitiformis]|uniref:Uncharacterized protein n=1 Tax=Cymbomonas tetramitiformis TaxID=36881 RepID=A0AAE0FHI9_9CHLO|nr:hypothetical protein CYMTET_31558 [Cymbomonas tetramitiformis]KAK3259793.1 hypothetical protein CYMTET_31223 [Cymbomonas tetramitiformis]
MRGTTTALSATRHGRTMWTRMFSSGPDDRSWSTITDTGAAEESGSPAPRGRGRGSSLPDPGSSAFQASGSPGSDEQRMIIKKGVGRGRPDLASDATSTDSQVVENPWEGRARENRPKIVPRGREPPSRADGFAAYDNLSRVTARDSGREEQRDDYHAPARSGRKIFRKEKEDDDEEFEIPEAELKGVMKSVGKSREFSEIDYDAIDHFFNMELDPQLRLPELGSNPEMWNEMTTRKPEDILTDEVFEHIEKAREQYALHQLLKPWHELELHPYEFEEDNDQFVNAEKDSGQFDDAEEAVEEAVIMDGSNSDGAASNEVAVTDSPSDEGEEEEYDEEIEASELLKQIAHETAYVAEKQGELEEVLAAAIKDGAQNEAEEIQKQLDELKEYGGQMLDAAIKVEAFKLQSTMSASEERELKRELEAEAKDTDTEGEDVVSFEKLKQMKEELDELESEEMQMKEQYSDRLPDAVLHADEEFIDQLLEQIAKIQENKRDPEQWEGLRQDAIEDFEMLEQARLEKEQARGASGLKHVKEEGAALAAMAEAIDIPKEDPLAELVQRAAHTMQGNRSMTYKQKAEAMDEILDSLDIPKKESVSG